MSVTMAAAAAGAGQNVHAVGIGKKIVHGRETDTLGVRLYVTQKIAVSAIAPRDRLPASIDGIPTDVIEAPMAFVAAGQGAAAACTDGRKQRQREHSLADCPRLSEGRLAPRVTQIGIGQRARRHAHKGGEDIIAEADAGQSKGIIHEVEGKKRHQPDERDETPAFLLDSAHQTTEAFAGRLETQSEATYRAIMKASVAPKVAPVRFHKVPQMGPKRAPPATVSSEPGTNSTVARAYRKTNRIGAHRPKRCSYRSSVAAWRTSR